jgi:hypothetical protein
MTRVAILTAFLLSIAAAQDVPPPPKPQDDGPSLDVTMKFLQDKLPSKVNYILYLHDNVVGTDGTLNESLEISNVSADTGRCRVDYHFRQTVDGKTDPDTDAWVLLKQVQEIVVMPMEQWQKQVDAEGSHPELSEKVDPAVFALVYKRSDGHRSQFAFYDETLSHRVAKALQHAVELCGGGSQEPF